jgi:hypothetical protein
MATRSYMPRGEGLPQGADTKDAEHPVNVARKDFGLAGEAGKPPGATPAPQREYDPRTGGYERTWGREPAQPGSNGYAGASSLSPGQRAPEVALAADPQPNTTRELVISKSQKLIEHEGSGADRMLTNSQTRDIKESVGSPSKERVVPTHSGTRGAAPGPKVTAACGWNDAQPVRQPAGKEPGTA